MKLERGGVVSSLLPWCQGGGHPESRSDFPRKPSCGDSMGARTESSLVFDAVNRSPYPQHPQHFYHDGGDIMTTTITCPPSCMLSYFSSIQSLSRVWLFATPWTAGHQASLSITNSQSLLKLTSIKLVMPSNPLFLCCPLLLMPSIFPSTGSFPVSQFFASGGQSIRVSSSASGLPMNIQNWFPLGWLGWISLQSKGLSTVLSNTTVQKHQFFSSQLSLCSNSHILKWLLEKP